MNSIKTQTLFRIILVIFDLMLVNLSYLLVFLFKFGWNIPQANFETFVATWPWLNLTTLVLLYFYKLYGSYRWRWAEVFASLICVVFFQALTAMALSFFLRGFAFPRSVLLGAPVTQLILLLIWRRATWHLERRMD